MKLAVAAVSIAMVWALIGVERIAGDHELGPSWQVFIKRRASAHVLFSNPAQRGLETVGWNRLALHQRQSVIDYCEIRFGLSDMGLCYTRLMQRKL